MPWNSSRPRGTDANARYSSKQHRADVAAARADLNAAGSSICAERRCVMPSRLIVPGMPLDLCHDRATGGVLGLGHRQCNRSEAGRYARSRQTVTARRL